MEPLVEKYISSSNDLELEIRFKIDQETFKLILERLLSQKNNAIIEQTIDISTRHQKNKGCSNRKTIYFENGIKKDTIHIKKCTLDSVFVKNTINYKISLASESEIPAFSVNKADQIRLKYRLSIILNEIQDWRFDFTLVKTLKPTAISQLQNVKSKMFPTNQSLVVKSFMLSAPFNYVDLFEFEVEYIGERNKINTGGIKYIVDYIFGIIDPHFAEHIEHQTAIYEFAQYIVSGKILNFYKTKFGLKKLTNQPIELTKQSYQQNVFSQIDKYYLTDKADGERCLAMISPNGTQVITATELITFENTAPTKTIIDAELVGKKDKHTLLVFDVLMFQDEPLVRKSFEERISYIERAAKVIPFAEVKNHIKLNSSNVAKEIVKIYKRKTRMYEIDGLIFTCATCAKDERGAIEPEYQRTKVYKWKPMSRLSIDFYVKAAPRTLLGIEPYKVKKGYTLYILFSGISKYRMEQLGLQYINKYSEMITIPRGDYFPIQFSPTDDPYAYLYYHLEKESQKNMLDGHVAEFKFASVNNSAESSVNNSAESSVNNSAESSVNNSAELLTHWEFVKLRPDKDIEVQKGIRFGNDYRTADAIWQNYRNPITFEYLLDPQDGYFAESKPAIYRAQTGFNSYVKSVLIDTLKDSNWVVDLAAGHGQDMGRIARANIKHALFIDKDADAIAELNKRRYSIKGNTKINTMVADLTTNYTSLLKELVDKHIKVVGKANGVIINFAIHYFMGDLNILRNLILLVDSLLVKGGYFIMTCFDGQKVFDLLNPISYGESIDWYEGDVLKYSIKKLFKANTLTDFNQQIAVKLPFSGTEYYEEFLVNIERVIAEFELKGYEYEVLNSFEDYLPRFKSINPKVYNMLTEEDKKYISLYSAVSLWKP